MAEQQVDAPRPDSIWTHAKYGLARVVAVSHMFCGGDELVTVEYLGSGLVQKRFLTYRLTDFVERFSEVKA